MPSLQKNCVTLIKYEQLFVHEFIGGHVGRVMRADTLMTLAQFCVLLRKRSWAAPLLAYIAFGS